MANQILYRDARTGRFRAHTSVEKNKYFKTDTLTAGLANFIFKSLNHMADVSREFATDLVKYAVTNAPWQDQTGDARAGLESAVLITNETLEISLYHTVDYGIWLEIAMGTQYAIIIPTIETMGPRLFDKMQGMFGDIIYHD